MSTSVKSATFDDAASEWTIELERGVDGKVEQRTLKPKVVVWACGLGGGEPRMPVIEGMVRLGAGEEVRRLMARSRRTSSRARFCIRRSMVRARTGLARRLSLWVPAPVRTISARWVFSHSLNEAKTESLLRRRTSTIKVSISYVRRSCFFSPPLSSPA